MNFAFALNIKFSIKFEKEMALIVFILNIIGVILTIIYIIVIALNLYIISTRKCIEQFKTVLWHTLQ